jgi:topoisomerase-4 subunit B
MEENITIPVYTEENIQTLEGLEHVRLRPGMYIGKLGDGSSADDGIYVLLKEIIDNSIDEFRMKCGNRIDINLQENTLSVRDFGRGIPQGKMVEAVSVMNTGGKYDSKAFKKIGWSEWCRSKSRQRSFF